MAPGVLPSSQSKAVMSQEDAGLREPRALMHLHVPEIAFLTPETGGREGPVLISGLQ